MVVTLTWPFWLGLRIAQHVVLGRDRGESERQRPASDDATAVRTLHAAYLQLVANGWQESRFAPADYSPLEVIEAGSTGIHRAYRDEDRSFWVVDDRDSWPSQPILYRLAPTADEREVSDA